MTAAIGRVQRAARRRWVQILTLVVLVVVLAGVVAAHIDLGYYVLTPGTAQPVAPLVRVPPAKAHGVRGRILLTDVLVTRVTALTYLADKLNADAQMVPVATLLGPDVPPGELVAQGYVEMAQSQSAAKAAALDQLGYHVSGHDAGALVFTVVPGSPAAALLSVGQIVTAVDGRLTPDACTFSQALSAHHPGQRVALTIEQSKVTPQATIAAGSTVRRDVVLARWPAGVARPAATPQCPLPTRGARGFLGVAAETQQTFRYPFPISVRTTSIGGPSAGLAMALGIIDTLGGGGLTGGRTVAATGTIDAQGGVGQVGGVPQKTVAVERAGATVFLVPAAQKATALSKATPSLRVVGVTSLRQALRVLQRLGGTVPDTASHGS